MPRVRKGSEVEKNGNWYARIRWTEETGKRKDLWIPAKNKSHASEIVQEKLQEIKEHGENSLDKSRITFAYLADYFEKNYLVAAEYIEGRKISGRRSLEGLTAQVNAMREFFGKKPLRSISYGDISRFRLQRLKTPCFRTGKQRSIASVNRELALLRRMLNVAAREQWLIKNPFNLGEPLISVADERKRERILSREEEQKLLQACEHPHRKHLRAIIICALDTGMRRGEILKLKWSDVDLISGLITVRAFNTKTMRERTVSITSRLTQELNHLWDDSTKNPDDLVFGISNNVKRSFTSVRKEVGLNDLRFHDLRHSLASRLDDLGFSLAKIGSQLGHTQLQTTLRYVNRDKSSIKQVANALDAFNSESTTEIAMEMIN
ncbi:MAG TPA: site-specific integrase [Pyrinomonadaceae bacterium]|jgi:integrase